MTFDSTVLVTIGRMNPPTPGHMKLLEKMFIDAINLNISRVNVILSSTVDFEKNPFECEDKRRLLYEFYEILKDRNPEFNKIDLHVVCMNDGVSDKIIKTPILMYLHEIITQYSNPEKIKLFIGEDRVKSFSWIHGALNKEYGINIPVEIETISRPPGAISATKIRESAVAGDWEKFSTDMRSTGLQNEDLKYVFDYIHEPFAKKMKKGGSKKRRIRRNTHQRKSYRRKSYRRKSYHRKM